MNGKSKKISISLEVCRELLTYDRDTGKLYWNERSTKYFEDCGPQKLVEGQTKRWNNANAGKEVGYVCPDGYLVMTLLRKQYRVHRICWFIHYGEEPLDEIDHINGVRTDNRLVNLRDVPQQEQKKNQKKYSNNTSGATGVYRHGKRWKAAITVDKKLEHLGYFDTFEEAVAVRKKAEVKYGFHKNHGRD